ncbi:nuclease-related domain-containing protein [Jeotgalibaca porci]|uniref:nuclease-related domain-containing protein n=3 Tax=Jeotgalibaca porci TaxID=1868793 RepID=UPI0035A04C99
MLVKSSEQIEALAVMKSLDGRVSFGEKEERYFRNWLSGALGEQMVEDGAACLDGYVARIHDLVIVEDRTCQIDALWIGSQTVYLLEVKHWDGVFTVDAQGFQVIVHDPLSQLERTKRMVERILKRMGVGLMVEARLVFTNPNMTLYGLSEEMPIVMPSQIERYFQKIGAAEGPISEWQIRLGKKLAALHVSRNPHQNLMAYSRESVRSGILCGVCRVPMSVRCRWKLACPKCGMVEKKADGFYRTQKELEILFPEIARKPVELRRWMGNVIDRKTVYNLMRKL